MSGSIPLVSAPFQMHAMDQEYDATTQAYEDDINIQEGNARTAEEAGRYNAGRQQDEANKMEGQTRADVGAAGITQDSGSVLDILRQAHTNAELDRLNIIHGADLKASDARNRAHSLDRQMHSMQDLIDTKKWATFFGAGAQAAARQPSGGGSNGQD